MTPCTIIFLAAVTLAAAWTVTTSLHKTRKDNQ